MTTTQVQVHGLVQGVGFRAFVRRTAIEFGLSGSVWNNSDGSVGISVSASDENLRLFLERIKGGHPIARVSSIQLESQPLDLPQSDDFVILRF